MRITRKQSIQALVVVATVGAGGATGIAVGSSVTTSGQPAPHDTVEAPPHLAPRPDTATIELVKPDPAGRGPAWAVQVSTSKAGGICHAVGRTNGGRLGLVDPQGRFQARPQSPAETCAPADAWEKDVALAAVVAVDGRLLVHGVAGPDVRRIIIGSVEQELSPKRAYLAVFPDESRDLGEYAVTAELDDGSTMTYPFTGPPVKRG